MSFSYPYTSSLKKDVEAWREDRDYIVWHNAPSLEEHMKHISGPIIEIGGPTDLGFYFLEGLALPSKPIITNISENPLPYSEIAEKFSRELEQIVDARDMPYENESVGIFLMAAMSVSNDWWNELSEDEKEKMAPKFEKEFDIAKMEMGLVATGVMAPERAEYAQRVQIFREVHRVLAKGGLFFSDGSLEDIVILRQLGFELAAFLQYQDQNLDGWQNLSYEFVVIK
ncbi:MAG TPA: hypothetical protein VGM08_04175 [Candidatus Saccharimonadales bacterium]